MTTLTIGQLANAAGIQASAIRYYERVGLMAKARRISGRRVYQSEDLVRLKLINYARELGFPIRDIKVLAPQWTESAARAQWLNRATIATNQEIERLRVKRTALTRMQACACTDMSSYALVEEFLESRSA